MADFGNWLNSTQETGSVALPRLPDEIDAAISTINGVVDFILVLLDVALAFLDVLKTFAVGFLDPLLALVDALISEIEAILLDIRTAGVYMTGDWYLAEWPFDSLLGGFQAFETRTIGRFLDRTDPTRPNLPETSAVLGVFLYHSVSTADIARLVRFLSLLTNFFRLDAQTTKTTQTPSGLRVEYGSGSGLSKLSNVVESLIAGTRIPDVATLSWTLSSPVFKTPLINVPPPPPHGFLIEVSTVRDGLRVHFDRPLPSSPLVPGAAGSTQDRESGLVSSPDGVPLTIFGGYDQILVSPGAKYNDSMSGSGEVEPGAVRVWCQKDDNSTIPIPLESLKTPDGKYLLQRSFFVPVDFAQRSRFGFDLRLDDMPYDASFFEVGGQVEVDADSVKRPSTFYARVAVVSEAVNSETDFKLVFDPAAASIPGRPMRAKYGNVHVQGVGDVQLSRADKGELSAPIELNFPTATSREYLDAVTAALAVLVLSRSDLPVGESSFEAGKAALPTGLEPFSSLVPRVLGVSNPSDFFNLCDEDSEFSDVYEFRSTLLRGCRRVASELYRTTGANPTLESGVLSRVRPLLDFVFSSSGGLVYDHTVLSALEDSSLSVGLSRNPEAAGLGIERGLLIRRVGSSISPPSRSPGFYQKEEGDFVVGSADRSPVLVSLSTRGVPEIRFVRNIFSPEVYAAARQVLGFASPVAMRPASDGAWISFRMGELIPPLDGALSTILEWARSLSLGSSSIVEVVVQYIEFLEARILELQGLLNRINGLVDDIIPIRLPGFSALFVLGNGTDDVLARFVNSGSKPVDSVSDYGGGMVMLVATPLSFVVDLLATLLSE